MIYDKELEISDLKNAISKIIEGGAKGLEDLKLTFYKSKQELV